MSFTGLLPYDITVPVLVAEDTIYARERIDHSARLLTQQRPAQPSVVARPLAMLQTPRPSPSLFEDRFASVYSVAEVYEYTSVPVAQQPWMSLYKPSNRLDDPGAEEQTRRFDLSLLHRFRATLLGQTATLSVITEIPDLCGDEWKEWVPQPIDHALRFAPFRQYLGAPPVPPLQILYRVAPNLRVESEIDFRVPDHARDFVLFRPFAEEGPFAPVHLECYDIAIGSLILRWSASPGAAGYRLYINGVPQAPVIAAQTTTVTGLAIDTNYHFNIVPVNTKGVDDGALSNGINYEHSDTEIMVVESLPGTNAGTLN